jgi:ribonuclease HI
MGENLQVVNGYSDGACKRNPGRGGWGAVLYMNGAPSFGFDGYRFIDYGGKEQTTNQEMELTAFLNMLRMCKGLCNYTLHTDSSYVVEALLGKGVKEGELGLSKMGKAVSFPGYISSWMSKGWKKADNGPVKHDHIWKDIVKACGEIVVAGSKLNIKWVKGHSGIEGNELADELANLGVPK